ncbi:MAG: TraR/DksA C4-type zinc finger protein [Rubrivivax sp.]|nr:TraR/DksA C4-type zinc finger protein [Rubrivivax sp.]
MSSHLTPGQRAMLRAALEQRQRQLDRRLADHLGGRSRAEHAREVLTQDDDDAPQRETERELDLALSDLETQEVGVVSEALRRIDGDDYGLCTDCGTEIPFDRLRAEPWAGRCVPCETAREQAAQRLRRG